jgi:cell shape-determining protein MreC
MRRICPRHVLAQPRQPQGAGNGKFQWKVLKPALTLSRRLTRLALDFITQRTMLIRISLIVAVVAGLAVAVINFVQVKEVITTTRTDLFNTSNTLVQTKMTLSKTEKDLKGTKAELDVTKESLRTTTEARDTALAEADAKRKQAADLNVKLTDTTKQRDDAQAELAAWEALGIPVNGVKKTIADLKDANEKMAAQEAEVKILTSKNRSLDSELAYYRDPEYRVKLREGLKGKVVISDPKWDFVVLNIGEEDGVLERGELLVNRDGKLVAKVRVFRVEKNRSIANLVSGWKIGEVVEGDFVIPAF